MLAFAAVPSNMNLPIFFAIAGASFGGAEDVVANVQVAMSAVMNRTAFDADNYAKTLPGKGGYGIVGVLAEKWTMTSTGFDLQWPIVKLQGTSLEGYWGLHAGCENENGIRGCKAICEALGANILSSYGPYKTSNCYQGYSSGATNVATRCAYLNSGFSWKVYGSISSCMNSMKTCPCTGTLNIAAKCDCENGEPATEGCALQPNKCASCESGYWLNGGNVCDKCNSCATGQYRAGCTGSSAGSCTACSTSTCSEGQYLATCANLNPGTCTTCSASCSAGQYLAGCSGTNPGTCQACASCPSGQYLSGCTGTSAGSCVTCTSSCSTGEYLANCANQNPGSCQKCNTCADNNYLDGCSGRNPGTCKARMGCTDTTHGFVDVGASITREVNAYAKSCSISSPTVDTSAYCATDTCLVEPDRTTCCMENRCTCAHGTRTISAQDGGNAATLCESDAAEDCSACQGGYHLSAPAALGEQTCERNVCTCKHGTPTNAEGDGATLCTKHGQNDCSKCEDGYHLTGRDELGSEPRQCEVNTCTCSAGTPAVATGSGGTLCKTDNTEDCSSCKEGYQLSAAADENLQTCQPNVCNTENLPKNDAYDVSGCRESITTDQTCHVGCAAGYTGDEAEWTCKPGGHLTGSPPSCEAQKCNSSTHGGQQMFTSHVTAHNCSDAKTGETCTAECNAGYSGAAQTYKCGSSGFTGQAMNCEPDPCDASHDVENGNPGDCSSSLPSGRICTIKCNEGFTRQGVTDCLAGSLRSAATCEPDPCDASEPPKYGTIGNCNASLASGTTCQPQCDTGYKVSGASSCERGKLTAATCTAKLQCHLVYEQNCKTQYGYWSDKMEHLNYPDCEHFCNAMHVAHGTIKGCELAAVTSEVRASVGKWCFAHEEACAPYKAGAMAAAACVPLAE